MLNFTSYEDASILKLIVLLVIFVASIVIHFRAQPKSALKYASIWVLIMFAMVLAYSYRYEAANKKNRILSELVPSMGTYNQDGSLSYKVALDGHYYIDTVINNRKIKFMVDTGASDIVLTKEDAQKIGINLQDLEYTKIYYTANGVTYGAAVMLDRIKVDNFVIYDIKASVNKSNMNISLLGMRFLNKLRAYEVKNGMLTIWFN